jgi:hypothetical protein
MAEQKSSTSEEGKGVPPAAEPPAPRDLRLFPGGSLEAAKLHIGMNAVDPETMWIDDVVVPGVKSTF